MIRDIIRMAISNLLHRRMRSGLTLIGIFIGITAVISVVSLGQGLQVAINEQFAEMGIDKIYIQPGGGGFSSTNAVILDQNDIEVVERSPGIRDVVGAAYKSAKVEHGDEEAFTLVMGFNEDGIVLWKNLQAENIEQGRMLEKGDTFKAFVGYDYSKDDGVFERGLRLHDSITINGYDFDIVGFQEDLGNSQDNQQIQITGEGYARAFGTPVQDSYMMIIARTVEGIDPAVVAAGVKKDLRRSRGLDEGDEDFSLQTAEEFLASFNSILMIVQVVIVGIAAVSLVIGGIGIMNTMYTAVVERTQEIGIMKAIGARNGDIMTMFLVESGMLGLLGGVIGVLLGIGIAKAVEIVGTLWIGTPYLRAWWSWELIAAALLFAFVVGVVSGALPAWQASKHKPVESLQYE